MESRIKEIRKVKGLTQQEFSDRIGVKRNTIAQYESGRNAPIDAVIALICREFSISETWLRTGEGEMCQPRSRNEELLEFAAKATEAGPGDIRAQLLTVMARLTDDQWQVLADVARQLVAEMDQNEKDAGPD